MSRGRPRPQTTLEWLLLRLLLGSATPMRLATIRKMHPAASIRGLDKLTFIERGPIERTLGRPAVTWLVRSDCRRSARRALQRFADRLTPPIQPPEETA